MKWLEELKRRWKNRMTKTLADTGLAREFASVFDVSGVPAFQQFYRMGIFLWKWLWKGFYKPWHIIPCPTIENPKAEREAYRMNAAKAICAEMAGLAADIRSFFNFAVNR